MCGLSGVFKTSYLTSQERKAFIDLGSISFFRGTDSTGVGVITRKKPTSPKFNSTIIKGIDHAVDFFRRRDVLQEIHNNKSVCLIGHARAATHGDVNSTNAQPIREGSIVGTHNGVIRRFEPERFETKDHTDSRKLFKAFDKNSVFNVLESLYSNDAYALVWMDTEYNTLNFIRNDKRPLYLCKTESGSLFWSSDSQMIVFSLARNDMEYKELKPVPEGILLSIDMASGKPTTREFKKETSVPFVIRPSMGQSVPIIRSGVSNGMYSPSRTTPTIPALRDVVKDELTSTSTQSVNTHKPMIEFMRRTTQAYVKGGSALIDDDNVIPFLTMKENEGLVKDADGKQLDAQIDRVMSDLKEEAKSKYPFLYRPGGNHSAITPLAEYKMRRHGTAQWVSFTVAESYLNRGCMCCGESASVLDTVSWKDPSNYLCATCYRDENLRHFHRHNSDWVESEYDENPSYYKNVHGG